MANTHTGQLDAKDLRVGIVVSRYNTAVTERLLNGALRALRQCGANESNLEVVYVPGAFETPLFAASLANSGKFDALICLGAIVRGETHHHDYLARVVFDALQHLQLTHHLPVALGILTTENVEQALRRAGDDPGNKGFEAAMTAIDRQPAPGAGMMPDGAAPRRADRVSPLVQRRRVDQQYTTSDWRHGGNDQRAAEPH
jgi:6,7-dimethyl-8-ribityllumazine synthase